MTCSFGFPSMGSSTKMEYCVQVVIAYSGDEEECFSNGNKEESCTEPCGSYVESTMSQDSHLVDYKNV